MPIRDKAPVTTPVIIAAIIDAINLPPEKFPDRNTQKNISDP